MEHSKLSFSVTLADAFRVGVKNIPSVLAAYILWLLTIWIPYINVGTTIALSMMPLKMADGGIVNPLYIFDALYRKYMGEYLLTYALMILPIFIAFLFMIVPGVILSITWSLALFFLMERGLNPIQSIKASNEATYGSKWTIFGVIMVIVAIVLVLNYIVGLIFPSCSTGSLCLTQFGVCESLWHTFFSKSYLIMIVISFCFASISHAANASVWRQLRDNA